MALADHEEGANLGLGGAGTNGLCWMGEDTDAGSGFQGHLVWKSSASSDCSLTSHIGGLALYSHTGTSLTDTDIAETAWLAGTDLALTDISIFARNEITDCTDDPSCEAAFSAGYVCDTASALCYLPGGCDATNESLAPCSPPTTCEPGLLGGDVCTGCTATNGGCRTGETCLEIGIPSFPGICLSGGGIPGP